MTDETTTDRIAEYKEKLDTVNERIAATVELIQKYPERWTLKYTLDGLRSHKTAIENQTQKEQSLDKTQVEIEVQRLLDARNKVGRDTYGKGLNHSDLQHNWYDMALEEGMDLLKYIMAQKLRVQHGVELTDENIQYVAGKIYYDRIGRDLKDEGVFVKKNGYTEASERIENFNYITRLLWYESIKD